MRWVVAVGLVAALAACAPADAPAAARAPGATGAAPSATTPSAGETGLEQDGRVAALDWSVAQLGGGQIEGGDLVGRDVVLWFWAPW